MLEPFSIRLRLEVGLAFGTYIDEHGVIDELLTLEQEWTKVPNPLSEHVTLTESSFRDYLDRSSQNLSFFNKCKFVVTGADRRADVLIDRLRGRNELLRTYVYMPWH